jgi:hypothetical protein
MFAAVISFATFATYGALLAAAVGGVALVVLNRPRLAFALGVALAFALPLAAIAQAAAEAPAPFSFDPAALVALLPLPATVKAVVLSLGLPALYFAIGIARRFTVPTSPVGKLVRLVLSGWKHPSEVPPAPPPQVVDVAAPGGVRPATAAETAAIARINATAAPGTDGASYGG